MTHLRQNQFYCVKCRARRTAPENSMYVKIYKNKKMAGGKVPALKAECSKCSTPLTKFIKHDSVDKMVKKYGK